MSRKNTSLRPSESFGCGDLHPALSFSQGCLIWPLWLVADCSGDADPSGLSPLDGFMNYGADAIRFRSYASEGLAKVPTMILCVE
jgi:hypothetical protein